MCVNYGDTFNIFLPTFCFLLIPIIIQKNTVFKQSETPSTPSHSQIVHCPKYCVSTLTMSDRNTDATDSHLFQTLIAKLYCNTVGQSPLYDT